MVLYMLNAWLPGVSFGSDFVRDYICVHELMHRREMNHSARYWRHVAEAFPRWEEAERWLKANGGLLR